MFAELTVEENLRVGGYAKPRQLGESLDRVYGLFPLRRSGAAGSPGTCRAGSRWRPSAGR